eukprot:scaffold39914_cov46-Prasinocladus_malaysianus.AAC.2
MLSLVFRPCGLTSRPITEDCGDCDCVRCCRMQPPLRAKLTCLSGLQDSDIDLDQNQKQRAHQFK